MMTESANESNLLGQLLRLHCAWSSHADELRKFILDPFGRPFPRYSRTDTADDRLSSLSSQFTAILSLEAQQWWTLILSRAQMVQFYAAFIQELAVRRQSYSPILHLCSSFRSTESALAIKRQVIAEIRAATPAPLNRFVGLPASDSSTTHASDSSKQTIQERQKRQEYRTFKRMERLHRFVATVGWFGILLGDILPDNVLSISDAGEGPFRDLLGHFANIRPQFLRMVEQHWPDAPQLLTTIGRNSPFIPN
jgi:hypothetical protein